jgi:hypothetical protein
MEDRHRLYVWVKVPVYLNLLLQELERRGEPIAPKNTEPWSQRGSIVGDQTASYQRGDRTRL